MELDELRREINSCDGELIKLIIKRQEISEKIGALKKEKGLPVFSGKREEERKNYWKTESGKYGAETSVVIRVLMELSKCRQKGNLDTAEREELESAVANAFFGYKDE